MKRILFAALLMALPIVALSQNRAAQSTACTPSGGLNFICGLPAPEDLVLVPRTRWLIASGMAAGSGLHLIDTQAKTARSLPFTVRADKARFPNCPGPADPKQIVPHGLSLRVGQSGRYTLYATNHGGRESIEVFEVDSGSDVPSAAWTGCVLLPEKLAANSVAAFSDGTGRDPPPSGSDRHRPPKLPAVCGPKETNAADDGTRSRPRSRDVD